MQIDPEQMAALQAQGYTPEQIAEAMAQQAGGAPAEEEVQQEIPQDAVQAQTQSTAGMSIEEQAQAQAEAQMQAEAAQQQQAKAAQIYEQQQLEAAQPEPQATVQLDADSANNVNQAAAVAAAAEALMPTEKDWSQMNAIEKKQKLAKIASEKRAKLEKEKMENPTVDENGEHIMTVEEAKAEAAGLQQMLVAGEEAVEIKI